MNDIASGFGVVIMTVLAVVVVSLTVLAMVAPWFIYKIHQNVERIRKVVESEWREAHPPAPPPGPAFKVNGVDKATGEDKSVIIETDDENEALKRARAAGMLPSRCKRLR